MLYALRPSAPAEPWTPARCRGLGVGHDPRACMVYALRLQLAKELGAKAMKAGSLMLGDDGRTVALCGKAGGREFVATEAGLTVIEPAEAVRAMVCSRPLYGPLPVDQRKESV